MFSRLLKQKKKRRPKHVHEVELETLLRHWPFVPAHARRTMVELAKQYGPLQLSKSFPTPQGADWPDVEIVMLSHTEVQITVKSVTQSYTFAALGLADKRQPKRPRAEWRMLRTYAENPEPDAYYRLPKRRSLKMDISKFRRWLQSFFGLSGDPLRPFKSALWLPRFRIRADYIMSKY